MRVRLTDKFPKRQIVVCVATLAALAVLSPPALGCSCVYLPKNSTAFRKASAVFVGEVVSRMHSKLPAKWEDDDNAPPVLDVLTFKVEKHWKGVRSSEVNAWVDSRYSNCSGMRFREGEKYLVYADSYKGSLVIYWCEKAALTTPVSSKGVDKQVKQLDSFWFRMRARLWPL